MYLRNVWKKNADRFRLQGCKAPVVTRETIPKVYLAITYLFYDDKPEVKRRSTANKRKPSQYSDRNKLAWCMEAG